MSCLSNRSIIPEVTVLIITYNQSHSIKQTLHSVISQKTNFPFLIVIADDCSTDLTGEICKSYCNKQPQKIKYIRRYKNVGLIDNLFTSLLNDCCSKYIALCAGDDYWIDDLKLQKQYDLLNSTPDVSVVLTGFRKYFEDTSTFTDINHWESPLLFNSGRKMIKSVLLEDFSFFPVGSSLFFRGYETINHIKSSNTLLRGKAIPGEAMILFPIFAVIGKYAFIEDITTVYKIHVGSVSHTKSNNHKIAFRIKYSIQKINVAAFYRLPLVFRLKQSIKFIYFYLYTARDGFSSLFVQNVNTYLDSECSQYVKIPVRIINILDKSGFLQTIALKMLKIANLFR